MNHPTLRELTEAVHGLAPRPEHLDDCGECRAQVERLERELEILRRADARLTPPRRSRVPSLVSPLVAAAALLAILAAIVLQPTSSERRIPAQEPPKEESSKPEVATEELIRAFLEGSEEAGKELRRRGAEVLLPLAEARLKSEGARRRKELLELCFEIKESSWSSHAAKAAGARLKDAKVSGELVGSPLWTALEILADPIGSVCVKDQDLPDLKRVSLKWTADTSMREVLDCVTTFFDADYDFRYGVWFISKPARLWTPPRAGLPAVLTGAQAESAREWIEKLGSESPEERERAQAELEKLGPAIIPLLEKEAQGNEPEQRARCEAILRKLRPPGKLPLPAANQWVTQEFKGEELDVLRVLFNCQIGLDLSAAPLPKTVDLLRRISLLNIVIDPKTLPDADEVSIAIKVKDLSLQHALELITLPYGLDAKIEDGKIVIFRPAK